jgi:hypothetical protein
LPWPARLLLRSFKDWLHGHTMEAALKAKCGCEASAAGLRQLLQQHRPQPQPAQAQEQAAPAPEPAALPQASSITAARTAALRPGGELTRRFLAPNPVVLQVGSTLFVHGGVLTQHVDYGLDRINREAQVGASAGTGVGVGIGAAARFRESTMFHFHF